MSVRVVLNEEILEDMMRNYRRSTRLALPLFLTLAAGASSFAPAHAGVFSISEKEEIQAGQQVRQQAYKEYGRPLSANHPMSQRVRALGRKFAALSERKNIPYTYEVLQNEEVLNAFAAPGGPIFVTTKLVRTTTNDAELAYVLGHETGHIDRKHIIKAVEKQQKVGLGVGILGTILGGKGGGNLFQVFSNVAFTVWTRGYSRDQETEADLVGTRWMSQLGFDPNAAVSMLGRLGGGTGGGVDKYLASHPAPKDRQAKVRQLIAGENLMDIARNAGGPRLTATDLPEYSYSNTGTNNYPDDDDDDDDDDAVSSDNEEDFRNAKRVAFSSQLMLVQRGDSSTIMAPVGAFARWAQADVDVDERNEAITTVARGRNSIRLRQNSVSASLNGRVARMSAPAAVYNGLLYAPLGSLAEGVGANASLSRDNRTVLLSIDGRRFYADVPYR